MINVSCVNCGPVERRERAYQRDIRQSVKKKERYADAQHFPPISAKVLRNLHFHSPPLLSSSSSLLSRST